MVFVSLFLTNSNKTIMTILDPATSDLEIKPVTQPLPEKADQEKNFPVSCLWDQKRSYVYTVFRLGEVFMYDLNSEKTSL